MKRMLSAAALLLLATACPKIERKVYTFDLASGTGSVRFVNIVSDDAEKANNDFMEVVNKVIKGTQLEEENPGWNIGSKELMESDGRLDGLVQFSFAGPADIGVYQHDKKSPLMWCADASKSETIISTNGKRIEQVIPGCVVWDRKAKLLEVTVREGELYGTEQGLLGQFKKWSAGEELPLAADSFGGGDPSAFGEAFAGQMMGVLGGAMGLSGTMTPGAPVVEGPLEPATVSASMARMRDQQLSLCYQASRALRPDLAGEATLSFTVGVDGAVADPRMTTSLGDAGLDTCIVDAVRDMTFPAPAAPAQVSYPMRFTAE